MKEATVSDRDGLRAHSPGRAHWLLLWGAVAGVSLAATGVFRGSVPEPPAASAGEEPWEALPESAVARVNGRLILRRDFDDVLALEVAGGMTPDLDSKKALLEEMIDEELRVQRGLELDLHLTDSRVRMDLASAVAEAAVARAEEEPPSEKELREYFDERREYFAQRGPLRVRKIWVGIVEGNLGEAFNRARTATDMLRQKEMFTTVKEILGSSDPNPIPERLLHPEDLARYIDRMALDKVLTLEPGEVSDPIRTIDGFHVIQVLERRANPAADFDDLRLEVEAELWRARARRALEANALELRRAANLQKSEVL